MEVPLINIYFVFLTILIANTKCVQVITAEIPQEELLNNAQECKLNSSIVREISSYDKIVRQIVNYVLEGPYKNKTYDDLAEFIDEFGARYSGSEELENSINFIVNKTKDLGLDVKTENVTVPHWVREKESAWILTPQYRPLKILGLGSSVGTPLDGLIAEVIVVRDFEELDNLADDFVHGKIVIYNEAFTSYGESVKYRSLGATKASSKGAVAALVRSITPFSINTLHTGMQRYDTKNKPIPVAAITVEDAEYFHRTYMRGKSIVIRLKMSYTLNSATSRNVLIDVHGSTLPTQQVIVSGHIDSWDVGTGAMDDGGGAFISWAVPIILKNLNIRAKRTIRTILWTGEEQGLIGAQSYLKIHERELKNINFVLESDEGTFRPTGLTVSGNHDVQCIVGEILKLFKFINASIKIETETSGSDIEVLIARGIPGGGLLNENEKYFWFHHSSGDTMTVLDSNSLDLATAFWTAVSYVIADISSDMPKDLSKFR